MTRCNHQAAEIMRLGKNTYQTLQRSEDDIFSFIYVESRLNIEQRLMPQACVDSKLFSVARQLTPQDYCCRYGDQYCTAVGLAKIQHSG